eukprot:3207405-Pyramimonas_sp.AAC.1
MGVGMPGRVSESGQHEWVSPESNDDEGPRPFARRKVRPAPDTFVKGLLRLFNTCLGLIKAY